MKKVWIVLLVLAMVMSLAACNASKDNAEKNKSEQAEIVSGISVGQY